MIIHFIAIMLATTATQVAATPTIELKPIGEEWQVHYRLPRPTRTLYFDIPYGDYRQTAWQPEDPSVHIIADGETIRAERDDRAPFTSVTFRLTPRYREVPKNYAPFSPFSDGGVLVFTGQFHACANAPCADGSSWKMRFLVPSEQLLTGTDAFEDRGDGRNVYVGAVKPIESPLVLAVIDPALPSPIRKQLDTMLPLLTDYFSRELGALPVRPMLFASLDRWPRPNSGLSSQGGILPGQVFLHFYGSGWKHDAARADFIPWFFAHEIGHFYHGARSGNAHVSEEEAWIHEGGAEAFAALAVREFGDEGFVDRKIARSIDDCAAGLARLGEPLTASARAGAFDNYYSCGLLLQLSIDADLRLKSDGRESLVTIWRDFLDRARNGVPWSSRTFLSVARSHGLSESSAALIEQLAGTPQRLTSEELRAKLNL